MEASCSVGMGHPVQGGRRSLRQMRLGSSVTTYENLLKTTRSNTGEAWGEIKQMQMETQRAFQISHWMHFITEVTLHVYWASCRQKFKNRAEREGIRVASLTWNYLKAWLYGNHLTFLHLSFFSCNIWGMRYIPPFYRAAIKLHRDNKWGNLWNSRHRVSYDYASADNRRHNEP